MEEKQSSHRAHRDHRGKRRSEQRFLLELGELDGKESRLAIEIREFKKGWAKGRGK